MHQSFLSYFLLLSINKVFYYILLNTRLTPLTDYFQFLFLFVNLKIDEVVAKSVHTLKMKDIIAEHHYKDQ